MGRSCSLLKTCDYRIDHNNQSDVHGEDGIRDEDNRTVNMRLVLVAAKSIMATMPLTVMGVIGMRTH